MSAYTRWIVVLALWLLAGLAHAGTKSYYYTDAQGTVLAKADAHGNIVASYDYAPYGAQVMGAATSGPTGYTGHVNDAESGLVYMQARYYDPTVGRFLSVDPLRPSPGNTFNFNRFDYAGNNPIVNIDPDGRDTVGENIDKNAQAAANSGRKLATYGWALAGVAWKAFGAESVSQVVDKGSGATSGDRAGAGLEILAAFPPVKIVGGAAKIVEEVSVAKTIVEEAGVIKKADALSGPKAEAYEKIKDTLSRGEAGGNQHQLGRELKGKSAVDLPGSGKGLGAERVIYSTNKNEVIIHDIKDYHSK